jgi:hypothetical protein
MSGRDNNLQEKNLLFWVFIFSYDITTKVVFGFSSFFWCSIISEQPKKYLTLIGDNF